MIFEFYDELSEKPENIINEDEIILRNYFIKTLETFPINRIRIRKNYSRNPFEISMDIEFDSIICNDKIYNKIVSKLFYLLDTDMVTLENQSGNSNFPYFFYGEKDLFDYHIIIFVDVPKENYQSSRQMSI